MLGEQGLDLAAHRVAGAAKDKVEEAIGHALDQYDIPFLVQSHDTGMFGPGMVGWSPAGAALLVPVDRVEEVKELLNCVVKLPEDALPVELGEEE